MMTPKEAYALIGDRAIWELKNMRRALSLFGVLNTDGDNKRLEAIKLLLKEKRFNHAI